MTGRHKGHRHLPAEISTDRFLIQRDQVIKTMLDGLGATVVAVLSLFNAW
ncbi:hypothetical protein [Brucella sp. NBRC 12950]